MANGLFGGGTGILGDPYLIEDAADLDAVRNNLSAHYLQVADIDCSSWGDFTTLYGIQGIFEEDAFGGSYNGQQYRVSNINIVPLLGDTWTVALFGATRDGCLIKNVTLENVNINIESTQYGGLWGLLVGRSWNESQDLLIENCHVDGNISCEDQTSIVSLFGGLMGSCGIDGPFTTTIRGCTSKVYIDIRTDDSRRLGGLIGDIGGGYAGGKVIIEDCYAELEIAEYEWPTYSEWSSGPRSIGGLVGMAMGGFHIRRCKANAKIFGGGSMGLLVGLIYSLDFDDKDIGTTAQFIEKCHAFGTINGYPHINTFQTLPHYYFSRWAGGLVGSIWAYRNEEPLELRESIRITDCYARGSIYLHNLEVWDDPFGSAWPPETGTFVGYYDSWYNYLTVTNCYSDVSITIDELHTSRDATSSFVAVEEYIYFNEYPEYIDKVKFEINNCYYNSELIQYPVLIDTGTPLTTAQMKYKFSYNNWDFQTIWGIKLINDGYPYFQWQILNTHNDGYPYLLWELGEAPPPLPDGWSLPNQIPQITTPTGTKQTSAILAKVDGVWELITKVYNNIS